MINTPREFTIKENNGPNEDEIYSYKCSDYANIILFKNTNYKVNLNLIKNCNFLIDNKEVALWKLSNGNIEKFIFFTKCKDNYQMRYETNLLVDRLLEKDIDVNKISIMKLYYLNDYLKCILKQMEYPFMHFISNVLYNGTLNNKILTIYYNKLEKELDEINNEIVYINNIKDNFLKFYSHEYNKRDEEIFLYKTFGKKLNYSTKKIKKDFNLQIKNLSNLLESRYELQNNIDLILQIQNMGYKEHTLKSTGELLNITRERVRQLLNKYDYNLDDFYGNYNYLSKFNLSKAQLKNLYISYNLYKECSKKNNELDYSDFLLENKREYRRELNNYLKDNNLIEYENNLVNLSFKVLLEKFINERYFTNGYIKDICSDFEWFCSEHNLQTEIIERNFIEMLNRNDNIIKGNKNNFIYLDIETSLRICKIVNDSYEKLPNVFSSKLLFQILENENIKLKDLDYFLIHNILKKHYIYNDLEFKRSPHIVKIGYSIEQEFYRFKKNNEYYALDNIVEEFSSLTGILSETLLSGYNGVIADEKINKSELIREKVVCFTSLEVKNSNLNFPFDKFNLIDNFYINKNYKNIRDVFSKNTESNNLVDIRCFSENTRNNANFKSIIINYRKSLEYLKFNNNFYLRIDEDLKDLLLLFIDKTIKILDKYKFISMSNCTELVLNQIPEVQLYGLSNEFFNQLYYTNLEINITNNVLMKKESTFLNLIENVIQKHGKMEITDLMDHLEIKYGANINRTSIIDYIYSSKSMEYSKVNYFVYKSKEYYIKFLKGEYDE